MTKITRIALSIANVLLVASLGHAATVARPSPKPWQASLRLASTYDETVVPRRGPRRTVTTMITDVQPRLQWRAGDVASGLDLQYTFDARFYEALPASDSLNHNLSLRAAYRPSPRWGWTLRESLSYLDDIGGATDETVTRLTTYWHNAVRGQVDLQLAPRWRLLAEAGHDWRDYSDQRKADYMIWSPAWELGWKPDGHRWTLRHEVKMFDIERQDVFVTHLVLAGYSRELPWQVRLDTRAGVLWFQDFAQWDPAWSMDLLRRWPAWEVKLTWRRSAAVETSTSELTRRDFLTFTPQWNLSARDRLVLNTSYILSRSLSSGRVDTTTWRGGLSWRHHWFKWLESDLSYTHVEQDARGTSQLSLSGNIVAASLRWQM